MFQVDRSGKKPDYPTLPMGVYRGEIMSAEEGESKAGRLQLVLIIEFTDGKIRSRVWEYLGTDDSVRIDAMLVSAGLAPGAEQINPNNLLNREVLCELKTETKAGYSPSNKVAKWLPPKPRVANPSAATAPRPQPAPVVRAPAPTAAPAVRDDDIPF